MRWLKWALVAAWVGVHAMLWTRLPALPRARLSGDTCRFSGDGMQLVTNTDRAVREYEVRTGRLLREWQAELDDPNNFYAWGFSAGGRRAVVYNDDGDCVLIDLGNGLQAHLPNLGKGVFSLSDAFTMTPDGRKLIYGRAKPSSSEYELRIYDIDGGGERLVGLAGKPKHVRISPDGRIAAVTAGSVFGLGLVDDLNIYFVDVFTGQKSGRDTVRGREWTLRSEFSPNGQSFAADLSAPGYSDNWISGVFVWDVASSKVITRIPDCAFHGWRSDGMVTLRGDNSDITDFLVDPQTGAKRAMSPQPGIPSGVEMDRDGKVLVVDRPSRETAAVTKLLSWISMPRAKDYTSELSCYDLSGRELARVPSRETNRFATEISPDGRLLAVSHPIEDGTINLYDVPPRKPTGIVLGLMIAEVTLAIAWTTWRRRRARSLRCAAL